MAIHQYYAILSEEFLMLTDISATGESLSAPGVGSTEPDVRATLWNKTPALDIRLQRRYNKSTYGLLQHYSFLN